MTQTTSESLLEILAQVPDPRKAKGKRHPLSAIFGLSVLAILCGYRSYSAIAEWGRTYSAALVKALGFTRAQMPCAATLHNLFKQLDIAKLESVLTQWTTATLQSRRQATPQLNTAEGVIRPLQQMHIEFDQPLDTHQTVETGHGRIEIRQLTASTVLNDYIQGPGVNPVFAYSYERISPPVK